MGSGERRRVRTHVCVFERVSREKGLAKNVVRYACVFRSLLPQERSLAAMEVSYCDATTYSRVLALLGGDVDTARTICEAPDVAELGPDGAVTRWTVGQLRATQGSLAAVENGLNVSFVLTSAYQVGLRNRWR